MTALQLHELLLTKISEEHGRFNLEQFIATESPPLISVDLVAAEWCSLKERRAIECMVENWVKDELPVGIAVVAKLHPPVAA